MREFWIFVNAMHAHKHHSLNFTIIFAVLNKWSIGLTNSYQLNLDQIWWVASIAYSATATNTRLEITKFTIQYGHRPPFFNHIYKNLNNSYSFVLLACHSLYTGLDWNGQKSKFQNPRWPPPMKTEIYNKWNNFQTVHLIQWRIQGEGGPCPPNCPLNFF